MELFIPDEVDEPDERTHIFCRRSAMVRKKASKAAMSAEIVTKDPQLRSFVHALAAGGLVIRKKRGVHVKNPKMLLLKIARSAFALEPKFQGSFKKAVAVRQDDAADQLVGEGIPVPVKGKLPWASSKDVADFLDKPHMLAAEDFSSLLHVSRETINQWRKSGKVIGVRGAKRGFRFPDWQINDRGQPYPAIEQILENLGGDHWAAWRFLEERVPEIGDIGFQALAAGKAEALLKVLLGRSYGSFS